MSKITIKTDNAPNLLLMVGPTCSGKSTFAKKRASEGYYIVSRDDERESLFGQYRQGTKEEEDVITHIVRGKVIMLLSLDMNVVLDNTHLKETYINDVLRDYRDLADIHIHMMPQLPLNQLNERNALRSATTGKTIPPFVVDAQFKAYGKLITTFRGETYYPRN